MTEPKHDQDSLIQRLDQLAGEIGALSLAMARNFANGEIASFNFFGQDGQPLAEVTDDRGMDVALSYGVWNDSAYSIEVGFAGGWLRVGPHQVAMFPVTVNGFAKLRISAKTIEALKEKSEKLSVIRWRFAGPQPFYMGAIAT